MPVLPKTNPAFDLQLHHLADALKSITQTAPDPSKTIPEIRIALRGVLLQMMSDPRCSETLEALANDIPALELLFKFLDHIEYGPHVNQSLPAEWLAKLKGKPKPSVQ